MGFLLDYRNRRLKNVGTASLREKGILSDFSSCSGCTTQLSDFCKNKQNCLILKETLVNVCLFYFCGSVVYEYFFSAQHHSFAELDLQKTVLEIAWLCLCGLFNGLLHKLPKNGFIVLAVSIHFFSYFKKDHLTVNDAKLFITFLFFN